MPQGPSRVPGPADGPAPAVGPPPADSLSFVTALPHLLWSATGADGVDFLGPQWTSFAGEAASSPGGQPDEATVHPEDWDAVRAAWIAGEPLGRFQVAARLRGQSGEYRWFDIRGSREGEDPSDRWYGSCADLTTAHETLELLQLERARWELLVESSPGVTVAFEPLRPGAARELNIRYASGRCSEILGFTAEHVLSHPEELRSRMSSADLVDVVPRLIGAASDRPQVSQTFEYDTRYDHPTLGERIMESRAAGAPMPDGSYRWQVMVTDVTDRRAVESALHGERERALVTLASIGDAVITTDADGVVTYLNPVAEALTGWTTHEAQGRGVDEVFELVSETTGEPVESPAVRCLREGHAVGLANHTALRDRHGRSVSIEDSSAPIRDANGTVLGAVLVFHDVSDAKAMTRALAHQASHDPLTGLANRTEFERDLNAALLDAATGAPSAVLYLDLDQFKVVNDSDGHIAGDALLCGLAGVLERQVRATDTVARLGGDEFGVILRSCGQDQAIALAKGLCESVLAERFTWEGRAHRVGVSIGLVVLDASSGTADDVLRLADAACYLAKEAGRGRVHVAHGGDERAIRRHGELAWVRRLHDVIEQRDLVLWAQPILPAHPTGEPPSLEILLRLMTEDGRLAAPGEFLPAAERYQLAGALDRVIVETALRWFAERPQVLERIATCSINLSGESVGDAETMRFIDGLFDELSLDGRHFCFEVTETAVITDLEDTSRYLQTLRARGCTVALDDFGVGLSSFSYLRTLPVDVLKIDGTFVRRVCLDPVDQVMVRSIDQVAHLLGKRTVAEYVEDDAIRAAVTAIGVDLLQGYGVGRPGPLEDVLRSLVGDEVPGLGRD